MYDGESEDVVKMNGLRQAVTVRSLQILLAVFLFKKGTRLLKFLQVIRDRICREIRRKVFL